MGAGRREFSYDTPLRRLRQRPPTKSGAGGAFALQLVDSPQIAQQRGDHCQRIRIRAIAERDIRESS
jgi:hypothetical protein